MPSAGQAHQLDVTGVSTDVCDSRLGAGELGGRPCGPSGGRCEWMGPCEARTALPGTVRPEAAEGHAARPRPSRTLSPLLTALPSSHTHRGVDASVRYGCAGFEETAGVTTAGPGPSESPRPCCTYLWCCPCDLLPCLPTGGAGWWQTSGGGARRGQHGSHLSLGRCSFTEPYKPRSSSGVLCIGAAVCLRSGALHLHGGK